MVSSGLGGRASGVKSYHLIGVLISSKPRILHYPTRRCWSKPLNYLSIYYSVNIWRNWDVSLISSPCFSAVALARSDVLNIPFYPTRSWVFRWASTRVISLFYSPSLLVPLSVVFLSPCVYAVHHTVVGLCLSLICVQSIADCSWWSFKRHRVSYHWVSYPASLLWWHFRLGPVL